MDGAQVDSQLGLASWFRKGGGSRYLQRARHLARQVEEGRLPPGTRLPSERDLAGLARVSRVTVRKAMGRLQDQGLLEAQRGAGSFVRAPAPKVEPSLSRLTSFTETMQARGRSSFTVLTASLFMPASEESLALGIGAEARVARIERLRAADGQVIAWERSSLPLDVLPDPGLVGNSLYELLRRADMAPVRAIRRITPRPWEARPRASFTCPRGPQPCASTARATFPQGGPSSSRAGSTAPTCTTSRPSSGSGSDGRPHRR